MWQRHGLNHMGQFDDAIAFLAKHEDASETRMNKRTTLTDSETDAIRAEHPGIPEDYLAYLIEIGWGPFRECQYMVYGGLTDPEEIFDKETVAQFGKRLLLFGDNFSGDPAGFIPDENWKVVELWHDSIEIYDPKQSFATFIRDKMLIGDDGSDLRA